MLGGAGLHLVKGLALGNLRQLPRKLRRVLVGVGLKGSLKAPVNLFPSRRQDGFALGGKFIPGAGDCGGDGLIHMGRGHGAQQLAADKGK